MKVKVEARSSKRAISGVRRRKNIESGSGKEKQSKGGAVVESGRTFSRWVARPTWPEFIAYLLTTKRSTDVSA